MNLDASKVCDLLGQLSQDGYVFRGHESHTYKLEPSVFRGKLITQVTKELSLVPSILEDWMNSEAINQSLIAWYSRNPVHWLHPYIIRLKNYCLFLMAYNHALHCFVKRNPGRVTRQDQDRLLLREVEFWEQEKTFQQLFEHYLPTIITRMSLQDCKTLTQFNPYEDVAGVDETLPQHYGIPTAALDWTREYFVAVYFALNDNKSKHYRFLKLFGLQIHNNNSPISIIDRSLSIENIRAERQAGTFSYFTKPCSFFICHGQFPTIDYFSLRQKNKLIERTFDLKEFVIERTEANINYLKNCLNERGINKQYLFPDNEALIEC